MGLGFLFDKTGKKVLVTKAVAFFIMVLSTISFTTFFFKDFPKAEIAANQLPGYIINFKDSKMFMKRTC